VIWLLNNRGVYIIERMSMLMAVLLGTSLVVSSELHAPNAVKGSKSPKNRLD